MSKSSTPIPAQNLSQQQLRLWLECQTSDGNAAYQMPSAVLVSGKIDIAAFTAAVDTVIQRHPLLHCRFQELNGAVQHIADQHPTLDRVQAGFAATDTNRLHQYIAEWCAQNLNIETGPLLRLQQAELHTADGKPQYLLLLNIHHLLSDGWSNRLLLQEMITQYLHQQSGTDTPVILPSADYFSYIHWQQQQLQEGALAESLLFWQRELADIEALVFPVQLSPDIPDGISTCTTILPVTDVTACARQWQVTPFAVLLAAWHLTLHKLTQQKCFAVMTPFANRQREDFFTTFGLFAQALPIVADFTRPQDLQTLVRDCHSRLQMANAHSEVPFANMAEQWQHAGKGDLAQLLAAAIHYDNSPLQQQVQQAGFSCEVLSLPAAPTKFPLALNIRHTDTLHASIEYDAQRFSVGFIERLVNYYLRALQTIIAQPALAVREFNLLTPAEQLAMLGLGVCEDALLNCIGQNNHTEHALPAVAALHNLIEQQCRLTPNVIAVSCDDYRLSFAELERQASQLASHILQHYGTGGIIAISLPRSALVSVALLGILKSGNAYLPLDAQFPVIRLQQIIDEAQPACVITSATSCDIFTSMLPCLLAEDIGKLADIPFIAPVSANPLFNVIYTSGSTGNPKGVRVLQRGIINRLLWMQAEYALSANDVVLQKTPLTFDVSVWELFWPLLAGARLHYARPDGHRDVDYLCEVIATQQISTLHFVPSMLDIFLENITHGDMPSLQRVFCSGETLHQRQVIHFNEKLTGVALFNLYGPTEASVDASYFNCSFKPNQSLSVSIGKPIWNTQLHILDGTLRPLPPGCIGELFIGGMGLAEGYQSNAALTAERFIDNPYYLDDHPSARLYKTGDLARYLPDGNIEFIGRNDLQVKLRGLRIELMDIEQQALQYSGVKRAAALIVGEQLLLFYQCDVAISHADWREFLGKLLPGYMLPNAFIVIAEWPLTSSGKTDRKALGQHYQPAVDYRQAQTAIEQQVQTVWENCLGKPVSTTTNFFEAGGHSLLAMRIVAQLSQTFDVNLNFRDIFTYSNIESMAAYINSLPKNRAAIPLAADAEQYPVSFQQQRLFLFQQLFPQSTAYHMPVAFDIHGALDVAALQQALAILVQRHAVLHTVYSAGDEQVWQKPLSDYSWNAAYADLSGKPADLYQLACNHDEQLFDLQQDLPVRALIVKLSDQHYLFCFCLHHIAGDALTLDILARELAALYLALSTQQLPSLTPLPLQYHDFASWQHYQAQQQDWQQQLAWWQHYLNGVPELLSLPHDRPRPSKQSYTGAQWLGDLDNKLVERLLAFCRAQQLTPFMVLLSCLQVFLGKLAQQNDVCVGVPIAGRDHPGLAALAGFFVNSIILRSQLPANPTFADFLQQQKIGILDAYAHQDIPVESVLASLGFIRSTRHNPVAQVGFNFLQDSGSEALSLALPGLQVTPLQTPVNTVKYEMTWIFYRHDAGIRLAIEYNTDLFNDSTISDWAGHFQTLLFNTLAEPSTPLQALRCLTDSETRDHMQQHFSPLQTCYPLTSTQRDIYLDSLLFPHKRHNQLGFLTHSTTPLDIAVWRDVLQALYNHADTLRARIVRTHHPLLELAEQVIAPMGDLPASCLTYINHGDARLDEAAKQQASDAALFSPYAETDPLWRVFIHEFSGQNYLFILAAHHAMFDGVSIQMLGRLIKGNYQKRVEGNAPDFPANNYVDFVQQHRLHCDSAASYHFWQSQAATLQPYLDFRPLLAGQPDGFSDGLTDAFSDGFASIEQQLDTADWQAVQQLCKTLRSSPTLFFKAVFALAIKAWHRMDGPFCFTEVVLGRDKAFYTTQGLFFEQQPNIIAPDVIHPDNTLDQLLAALRQYRKQIAPFTPVSLHLQHQLLPVPVPYLFNFYIMESATPFFGKLERIEHLMPEMDHAVNCIVKVIDDQLHVQLMYNRSELQGDDFLALLMAIIHQCLQGKTVIADLLPSVAETPAKRFSLPTTSKPKNILHKTLRASAFNTPAFNTPANNTEQQLLAIWQEVLGRDDIGVDDNFFELGGHSLHAMRIASRLREEYALELPLEAIFHTPTIAAIALAWQQSQTSSSKLPPINKAAASDVYPLSHAQKRLWFLTQIDEANLAYNIPAALRLDGPLDKPALQNALQALLERHTLLRSVIDNSQGLPQWRVQAADSIALEEIDCPHDATQTWLHDTINAEAQQPFYIHGHVLLRMKLLALAPQQHVLLLTLHHLLGDAQSLLIIARELAALYTAFHHRQANPLPALPLQFSDYSYWQQELLRSELIREQLAYWVSELDQAPPLLGLPLDRPRPALQTFHGAQLAFSIDADLTEKLQAMARNHGVTLFMLLLASYQLLLSQLCQQRDVCVGIPRDGRTRRELEPLVGFFINALVIRTRLDANYSLSELLLKVRDKTLLAFANELVPAEQVMQALHIERQLQFMPIVQAAFNYLNADEVPSTFNLDGLQVGFIEQEIVSAKFECLLTVVDQASQLQASFEYNTDLFDTATIERFRDSWLYLLTELTRHPHAHINQLRLPGQQAAEEIICLQGEPAIESFDFMQAITAQSASHPDAMAFICGNKHLSYAELDCAANAVAHHLLSQGVQRGDRIAILMPNRVELLPVILGAVKAGACYVPMDVNYPAERLRHILKDAAPAVLITEQHFQQQFYPDPDFAADIAIMDIDTLDLSATTAPVNTNHGDLDLLYMIYTSGSTGLPKGASVYYRSESNLLAWYTKEFDFNSSDKTLVMSSPGFDLTQKNLFALLTVGGTVVLAEQGYYDVKTLLDTIDQYGITTLNCAPSAFYPLVESCDAESLQKLRSLRTVLLGGEPVQLKRLSAWLNAPIFNCSMVNMYGPTECTDISAFHTLAPQQLKKLFAEGQANEYIFPLGKPCAGVSLYILNDQLQSVANGLAGELCISGINLGAGYWQQAELTANAFVPNPFATGEHDRLLYRSGDLVRLDRDDGLLYYLGRKDFQLKLRGLRIEPGEIEQVLRSLPAILDAVVLLDNSQLLAFVLTDEQHKSDGLTGWREYLFNRLPDYMVPNLLIPVSSWPLTPNGKIDRQALLDLPRPASAALYIAPRTAIEEDIAMLWQDILGIDKAGVFDNFFESGGDSLTALRLLAALEKHFNARLPVASLFGAQTIAQLALVINSRLSDWSPIVPIQPQGSKTPIFALHSLGAVVLSYEPLARALGNNQPFYGIQAYGLEEGQTPFSNLHDMLEFYVAAIRQQQPHGPYQIIGHSFGGILAIELARALQQQDETVKFVGLLDTHIPSRYTEMAVDDAQVIDMIHEQFHGLVSEEFSHRAISVVRGLHSMMTAFQMQPIDNIPLLLFTPQDLTAKLQGLALNISQRRVIKTRGFEKISNDIKVIAVPGDHYSLLKVNVNDVLVETLKLAIGYKT